MRQIAGWVQDLIDRLLRVLPPQVARRIEPWWNHIRWPRPRPRSALPPGAFLQRTVIPAYWTREPKFVAAWDDVRAAGQTVRAVVIEQSWPQTAKNLGDPW